MWRPEYREEDRTIAIRFKSGKRVIVQRFEEALRLPEIEGELPIRFAASYRCGAVRRFGREKPIRRREVGHYRLTRNKPKREGILRR